MKVFENFDLTEFNGYKVKSICKTAYFPENESDILDIVSNSQDLIVLGSGNNIILSKEYYDADFLIISKVLDDISVNNNVIEAGAGCYLHQISEYALLNSLSGLEFCYDIPSSVGGAIVMNAGTKEGVISDVLLKVRYLDLEDLQIKEMNKNQLNLDYRSSVFQTSNKFIILKAWFLLNNGNSTVIKEKMIQTKTRRWNFQPRELPSCGSVFKRPNGMFVGPMIEELKLKGLTFGGAQISLKHGGFIVNIGNAKGSDILNLINKVQIKIKSEFGVDLEIEQRII